jgi:hypothetical protein
MQELPSPPSLSGFPLRPISGIMLAQAIRRSSWALGFSLTILRDGALSLSSSVTNCCPLDFWLEGRSAGSAGIQARAAEGVTIPGSDLLACDSALDAIRRLVEKGVIS